MWETIHHPLADTMRILEICVTVKESLQTKRNVFVLS